MKKTLHLKLFFAYILIVFLTLLLVSWFTELQVEQHIQEFYEKIKGMGFAPPEGMLKPNDAFVKTVQNSIEYSALAAGVVALLFSYITIQYFTGPIRRLIRATKEIAQGNYHARVPVESSDEIGELTASLNTMAASLENHRFLQKQLITNVAHELATPLTNISGYLEALNDNVITGETKRKETLELMQDEARRLESMLDEVRTLVAVEEPHYKVERSEVDIKDLTARVLKQIAPQFKRKKIPLQFHSTTPNKNASIDKNRYTQILLNLLTNALKYSNGKSVAVTLNNDETGLTLTVADQGEGIPEKDLPFVFERFYRVDPSRNRHTGGLGVGLAIVKELVEAHGGTVSVTSTIAAGTSFTVSLPAVHSTKK